MIRPTDRELQAMSNLYPHPEFEIFVAFLERVLEDETKTCIYSDSPDARGRAQVVTEQLATIKEARKNASTRVAKRAVKKDTANAF